MRKATMFLFLGLLLGTALAAQAVDAAAGISAERSGQAVYVDGQRVELEAYIIDGSSYVKLRDIAEAVDFNVYWDGSAVQVQSSSPYTGTEPERELVDYSAAANPEIFTGVYTRELFNATSEVFSGIREGDLTRTATAYIPSNTDRQNYENLLANLSNGITFGMRSVGDGFHEIYLIKVDRSPADAATADLIQTANRLNSDRDGILFSQTVQKQLNNPDGYRFLQEVLIPGSTKS